MIQALEKLADKGYDGMYPRGCIHDDDCMAEFEATDNHHTVRICSRCLEELNR